MNDFDEFLARMNFRQLCAWILKHFGARALLIYLRELGCSITAMGGEFLFEDLDNSVSEEAPEMIHVCVRRTESSIENVARDVESIKTICVETLYFALAAWFREIPDARRRFDEIEENYLMEGHIRTKPISNPSIGGGF